MPTPVSSHHKRFNAYAFAPSSVTPSAGGRPRNAPLLKPDPQPLKLLNHGPHEWKTGTVRIAVVSAVFCVFFMFFPV
jgi:hypothetical protein